MEKGLIQIYTGNGKGKTTAALGIAMRALGHNYKIYVIQFMKNHPNSGELLISKFLPNINIIQTGQTSFVDRNTPSKKDKLLANKSLKLALEIAKSSDYDILILDEIITSINFNLIKCEKVIELLQEKSDTLEIILTGRNAPQELIEIADLVTEMKEIKHYYNKNIKARMGIEF